MSAAGECVESTEEAARMPLWAQKERQREGMLQRLSSARHTRSHAAEQSNLDGRVVVLLVLLLLLLLLTGEVSVAMWMRTVRACVREG